MVYVFLRATTRLIPKEEMIKCVCLIAIQDSVLDTYCYKNRILHFSGAVRGWHERYWKQKMKKQITKKSGKRFAVCIYILVYFSEQRSMICLKSCALKVFSIEVMHLLNGNSMKRVTCIYSYYYIYTSIYDRT